ncbi:MAG: hypothetical protein WKH64_02080 [Chloroflexia bacterium]
MIARIYNQGVEERIATFETRLRTAVDVLAWFDRAHPIVVVEEADTVVAFAATSATVHASATRALQSSQCTFHARHVARRGRLAMESLIVAAERVGY